MVFTIFNRRNLTRNFHVFLVLGNMGLTGFWESEEWSFFLRELDSVLLLGKGPACLYISCKRKDGSPELKEEKHWSDVREEFTDNPDRLRACEAAQIMKSIEVWTPDKKECELKNRAPDIFIGIRNENALFRNPAFNPYIVLAVDTKVSSRVLGAVSKLAENLANKVNAELRARTIRPWGFPFGKDAIVNPIGTLLVVDAFKVGTIHRQRPTLESLEGEWHEF